MKAGFEYKLSICRAVVDVGVNCCQKINGICGRTYSPKRGQLVDMVDSLKEASVVDSRPFESDADDKENGSSDA